MLQVESLHAKVDNQAILKGLNLQVKPGEVHAIMGPNGSGKSTLGYTLAGREQYEVTSGDILFNGESILELSPDERAIAGIFLSFQYPIEIPGISNLQFLKAAMDTKSKALGQEPISSTDFMKKAREVCKTLNLSPEFLKRGVNEGFSGGEKKRNEILQMNMLAPKLCILDETDSGLDIDALKFVAEGVNQMRSKDRSFVLITHYQRLLDYIEPDYVHVLYQGQIIKSGDKSLALELEDKGYGWLTETV